MKKSRFGENHKGCHLGFALGIVLLTFGLCLPSLGAAEPPQAALNEVRRAIEDGAFIEAQDRLDALELEYSDSVELHLLQAKLLLEQEQIAAALARYRVAVDRSNGDPRAYLGLARAYYEEGDSAQALDALSHIPGGSPLRAEADRLERLATLSRFTWHVGGGYTYRIADFAAAQSVGHGASVELGGSIRPFWAELSYRFLSEQLSFEDESLGDPDAELEHFGRLSLFYRFSKVLTSLHGGVLLTEAEDAVYLVGGSIHSWLFMHLALTNNTYLGEERLSRTALMAYYELMGLQLGVGGAVQAIEDEDLAWSGVAELAYSLDFLRFRTDLTFGRERNPLRLSRGALALLPADSTLAAGFGLDFTLLAPLQLSTSYTWHRLEAEDEEGSASLVMVSLSYEQK